MSAINSILSNLNEVKTSGFFSRLFSWGAIKNKINIAISLIENAVGEEKIKEIELKLEHANTLVELYEKKEIEREAKEEAKREAELEADHKLWKTHEDDVEASVRSICEKHVIRYIDKYPVKGQTPDNAIHIGGEIVILDAKSPQRADTKETFVKNYIPRMVTGIKKYMEKHDTVYPQMFLVVPDNTISLFKDTYYNKGTYEVFIIPKAALEPIILAIKEISKYELAEALTPHDKNNLVRIVGGLSDYTKRRVSVDGFMAGKAIELLYDVEKILPGEFYDGVVEFEKTNITNPSTEKRGVYETAQDVHNELKKIAIFPDYKLQKENE